MPPPANKPKPDLKAKPPADIKRLVILWALVICGICFITWLAGRAPKQRALNCSSSSPHSLLSFGTCTED